MPEFLGVGRHVCLCAECRQSFVFVVIQDDLDTGMEATKDNVLCDGCAQASLAHVTREDISAAAKRLRR